jgi:hypothetical protein
VKVQSDATPLLHHALVAFELAAHDTLDEAKRIASANSRTGTFERSLDLSETRTDGVTVSANLGSPLRSATTKERGAYIQARRAPWLVIPVGDGTVRKVKAVRIPARPVVSKAGPRFVDFMTARLKEQS